MIGCRRRQIRRFQRPRSRSAAFAAALWLTAALAAPPSGGAEATAAGNATDYMLGHGDRIRITVFGHEDLTGEFQLSETGTVSLPLAGVLDFNGVTPAEAQRIVVDALQPDYLIDPRVSIQVLEYRPFYIIGEVNNPGAYPYVNGMTVIEAVALGGGFSYRARRNRVLVIRATDETRTERGISANDKVLPGDVVRVLERLF